MNWLTDLHPNFAFLQNLCAFFSIFPLQRSWINIKKNSVSLTQGIHSEQFGSTVQYWFYRSGDIYEALGFPATFFRQISGNFVKKRRNQTQMIRSVKLEVLSAIFIFYFLRDKDTRLELAKSGIIGQILISRAHGQIKIFLKCCFIFLINILKSEVVPTSKTHAYCRCEQDCFCELTIRQPICTIRQPICTIRQPIAVRHIFFHNSSKFGRFI